MGDPRLQLGEAADEADWRKLVTKGLRGAPWERLVGRTADGIELKPLYRESDARTASDEAGFPGAAPFVRGRAGWTIRQSFAHSDPEETNREILADLAGEVGGVELVLGAKGCAIANAADLDRALANVILEAAPVSLDGATLAQARLLRDKLKGVAAPGAAFNLDPVGAGLRGVALEQIEASAFAASVATELPNARALRVDARVVHEAGASEAQEIAYALSQGIDYLRGLAQQGLDLAGAARTIGFAVAIGPDVLIEAAKLRALRLCWARVLEASGVESEKRAAHIHASTSKRMMTRYDAETNILRIATAAFAAAVGGADELTTLPFTDALGPPTPFARRVARNTQLVLMEESHLGHVADPAGGSWFVESLTRELAARAWEKMQAIEAQGGIVAALKSGSLQRGVAEARTVRQAAFARRKETITGVTDFPLLSSPSMGEVASVRGPEGVRTPKAKARPQVLHVQRDCPPQSALPAESSSIEGERGAHDNALSPIRWAEPFEALRDMAEALPARPAIFFATLGPLAEFASRAQFAANLFAVGGVGGVGVEQEHASFEAMAAAFAASGAHVAVIAGVDARYATEVEAAARALKAAGATWVVLAGKSGEHELAWRAVGVDQFVYVGVDVLKELETIHAALGVAQ